MKHTNLKLVWIAQGYLDAEIKKNYLFANGIDATMYEESLGKLYGFVNTPLGEVEIYVKPDDFERAKLLLDQLLPDNEDK